MDFCRKQVEADCEELLSRFQKTESVRFEVFTRMWREMNFSHIFHGLLEHEKRLFARLVLTIASSFFLPPYSFQIRVGGLYLLYSLYQCQTAEPSEQIRLALKDFNEVKRFEKVSEDAQHYDVVYIFRRLMFLKAFHFTAMPTQLTFQKKRKKVEKLALCDAFMERASGPQELISTELLEELSNIHSLYDKLKTSVCLTAEHTSTSLIRKDLVPQLRSTVMDFYNWQKRRDTEDKDEDSGEGPSSQQESSSRAELLASIKSKAYGEAVEASRSRRHRQVAVDFTSSGGRDSNAPGSSRTSKPSLKTRTNENIHISGDVWKEATSTTMISRLTSLDGVAEEKPKQKRFKW